MKVLCVLGLAALVAACAGTPEVTGDEPVIVKGEAFDPSSMLAPGMEIFNEAKMKESVAPAWTVYAVAYDVCGERLAIQYVGNGQLLWLKKREAKTDEDKHGFAEAVAEFDDVIKHRGNARVVELDLECVRT